MLKFTFVSILMLGTFAALAQTNIAPQAIASTSYVSPWETIAALNDNYTPANSNDKTHGAYGNWNNPNSTQWVQYDWSQTFAITSVQVYWFNDSGGVLTPTTAYLQYWNGSSWINLGNVPLVTNAFNTLNFTAVNVTRLRLSMLNTTQSTGLLEWRVTGTAVSTGGSGAPYTWPTYSPTISYDFRSEYPSLATPTQVLNDCPQVVGTQSSNWWTFRWGPSKRSSVTTAAITPMLARMNKDFAYFRDTMGWPPDLRARSGYRSAVYLFGSGLCTDQADSNALGGWQSAITYNGTTWPMVLASYYPVAAFNPAYTGSDSAYQRSAMVHEGIHAMLADLPGVKDAAWFHEGGNVWFQQTADAKRSGNYSSLGFLNGTDFIAPFMPIECYSGWLQDGSFGGPSAEGVNMFNGSQQICTWRTFLGGHQYSSSFPTFVGNILGNNAVPWVWRYASSRVLAGMASGLGEVQMRRLITEYRAKQALVDFGPWKSACVALLNSSFGTSIGAEWQPSWLNPTPWIATPYVKTTNNSGTLTPDTTTLPGWSGANQIPLTVTGNTVTVNFQPIGAHMTCQLVYWTSTGAPVYSAYVSSGNCTLNLASTPANNIVIAVVTNTDYTYAGETTRKAKFDYRLQLVTGVTGAASVNTKWYNAALSLPAARVANTNNTTEAGIDWSLYCAQPFKGKARPEEYRLLSSDVKFLLYPNPVTTNSDLEIRFSNPFAEKSVISVLTLTGGMVHQQTSITDHCTLHPKKLRPGVYFVRVSNTAINSTQKLVVQ